MNTIEIKPDTRIDVEDILNGVSKLSASELEAFVERVLALRANRIASGLPENEAALLKKINRGLPKDVSKRLAVLESKRQEELLTKAELEELISLTEQLEQLNAERVEYLGVLAQIRNIHVRELMAQLGIKTKPYD
mgnify:FL=1